MCLTFLAVTGIAMDSGSIEALFLAASKTEVTNRLRQVVLKLFLIQLQENDVIQ